MENLIVELIALLIIKHFIVDFLLQGEYQWRNKGTLGHPGGIIHAGLHGVATGMCVWMSTGLLPIWLVVLLASGDSIIHYFVDWAKMNINKYFEWKADTHPQFWYALGVDQLCHYMTYVFILVIIVDFLKN